MSLGLVLAVGLAAGTGAVLRALAEIAQTRMLDRLYARHGDRWFVRPGWATLQVNVVGSALLGVVAALVTTHGWDDRWLAVVGAGLAGGLTTFSTLAVELADDLRGQEVRVGLARLVGHLALGLGAAAAGYALAG